MAIAIVALIFGLAAVALTTGLPIPVAFVTAGDKFPGEDAGGPGFGSPGSPPVDQPVRP